MRSGRAEAELPRQLFALPRAHEPIRPRPCVIGPPPQLGHRRASRPASSSTTTRSAPRSSATISGCPLRRCQLICSRIATWSRWKMCAASSASTDPGRSSSRWASICIQVRDRWATRLTCSRLLLGVRDLTELQTTHAGDQVAGNLVQLREHGVQGVAQLLRDERLATHPSPDQDPVVVQGVRGTDGTSVQHVDLAERALGALDVGDQDREQLDRWFVVRHPDEDHGVTGGDGDVAVLVLARQVLEDGGQRGVDPLLELLTTGRVRDRLLVDVGDLIVAGVRRLEERRVDHAENLAERPDGHQFQPLAVVALGVVVRRLDPDGLATLDLGNVDAFFVTLKKSESDYSPTTMYQDYPISPMLFHWESQSTTSTHAPTGQRYLSGSSTVLLFVREQHKDEFGTSPYLFAGPVSYVTHEGDRPIAITWKLQHALPSDFFNTVAVATQ